MGQHRLAGYIADGVDVAHRSLAPLADANEPAIHVQHEFLETQARRRRRPADRHQDLVGRQLFGLIVGHLDIQGAALGRRFIGQPQARKFCQIGRAEIEVP